MTNAAVEQLRFDGRVAVVTGAGRGLGRHHALLLAERGAKVVIADYGVSLQGAGSSSAPADEVADEIRAAGGEAVAVFASVSDPAGAAAMVQAAVDTWGHLDVVVNNAGIVDHAWMDELTQEQLMRLLENHALGHFLVTKAAWPHLLASGAGRVVNTISESMLGQVPKSISYATAKGAVFGFTRGVALDGMRHGIRVNAVAPRGITRAHDPELLASVMEMPKEAFKAEFFASMAPELVSPAVVYLAHESCTLDGEVLVAGAGQVRRLVVSETAGIERADLTPEDVAAEIDVICDPTGGHEMPAGVPTP
jgi:NAD(P)-dependent dehydrogenase (short-subunit alcohol dehydrogenase family)